MRVAYIVNHYPAVSHSFIRREILALEAQGIEVTRIAVRGWSSPLADPIDVEERSRTRFVLREGAAAIAAAVVAAAVAAPRRFARALRLATRLARGSDRPLAIHWVYLAEACVAARWMRAAGARHAHAHFGTNSTAVAMLAATLGGTSYSFTVHGPDEFDRPRAIGLAEKIRRASFVVAISSYTRSQLYRWIGVEHWPKVQVVHCGLDAAFRAPPPAVAAGARRLVCVGRLSEQKGHLLLLEAMRRVFDAGTAFELVLAGDGEMRADVEARVAVLGLAGHVRITGWIGGDDVRRELLAARALVLPSFAEGLPVVIMEAMALRRPVVTTWVAGIPELVVAGETGWLAPAGDVASLAEAIAACLAADAGVLERMGDAARRRVLERHDADVEAAKLAGHFRALGPGSASPAGVVEGPGAA